MKLVHISMVASLIFPVTALADAKAERANAYNFAAQRILNDCDGDWIPGNCVFKAYAAYKAGSLAANAAEAAFQAKQARNARTARIVKKYVRFAVRKSPIGRTVSVVKKLAR